MSSMITHTNSKENLSQKETFVQRPRRVCPRKSYCEDETEDDETSTEEMKQYKPKAGKRKESHSFVMLEKKQKQIAQTLRWLGENYELKEAMCLPRCVMYTHYLDFCRKGKLSPSGPATFGKIIRQRFPKLTTRRLGTRGQSKYHYYGIVVKETSAYFHAGYSKKGLTRFSGMKGKGDVNTSHKKFSLSSKSGTLLPDFPNGKNVELPDEVSPHKVETFIMMYRTHCQRMLDTIISANFEGVQNFITHFWQGMPDHIISVLSCSAVVDIVAICDSILYKVIIDVLIPSTIQDLPESLREEITNFADSLLDWLNESLTEVPLALREAKFEVAKTFTQALKRQVCFVHLAQAARSALLSYEDVSRMLNDLSKIDFSEILSKSFFISENKGIFIKTKTYVMELENLLSKQAPLEAYIEWLDSVVDRCLLKEFEDEEDSFEERCRKFLAMWSFITSRVLADLTLRSAPSFGVFHLIHTAFEEYVFLVVENQKMVEMDQKLRSSLQRRLKKAENQMPIQANESKLEEPKENRQPQDNPIEPKEIPRAKRRKTATAVLPRSKLRSANDQMNQQSTRNVQRIGCPEERQCAVVSAPQVGPADQHIYQTAHITNPTRPYLEPTSMGVSTNLTSFTPMQNRPTFQQCHVTDLDQQRHVDNIPEVNAFQGDFISAIDKAFFSSNVTLSTNEYMGATWIQNEPSNLTVLNSVNFQENNPVTNAAMNFPRGGNYEMNYSTSVPLSQSYTNTHSFPTNPRPQEISYISPTKDDFGYVPSITNIYSRLNTPTSFYDHMRNAVQVGAADVTGVGGLLNAPASSVGMDGLSSHNAQLNRLGIGAM